jgi:hypothetical protein
MQDILKNKITTRGRNNRMPNVTNIHTRPVCSVDLIGAVVLVPYF